MRHVICQFQICITKYCVILNVLMYWISAPEVGQSILSPIITHATTTLSNLFITFLKAFWLSKKKWVGILGFWTSGEMCGAQTRELFYKTIKPLSITSDER